MSCQGPQFFALILRRAERSMVLSRCDIHRVGDGTVEGRDGGG